MYMCALMLHDVCMCVLSCYMMYVMCVLSCYMMYVGVCPHATHGDIRTYNILCKVGHISIKATPKIPPCKSTCLLTSVPEEAEHCYRTLRASK